MPAEHGDRRAELVASLAAVRNRLSEAAGQAGRDPRAITLVAVTKTFPATDAAILLELGVVDLGESRDQEASAKASELAALRDRAGDLPAPRWHFVGQLQSRKSRSVASYSYAVHSVDRVELVGRLAAAVAALDREPLRVFVQVSLDGDPSRGGALPVDVAAVADAAAAAERLQLVGVMAVAPLGWDPHQAFARLAEVSVQLRAGHPDATAISAGMSDDLEPAVAHGATHVRVGSALLGRRGPLLG